MSVYTIFSKKRLAISLAAKHQAIERHNRFQSLFGSGSYQINLEKNNLDTKNYVKYLLKEGATFEKREMFSCSKSKLVLTDKGLKLIK